MFLGVGLLGRVVTPCGPLRSWWCLATRPAHPGTAGGAAPRWTLGRSGKRIRGAQTLCVFWAELDAEPRPLAALGLWALPPLPAAGRELRRAPQEPVLCWVGWTRPQGPPGATGGPQQSPRCLGSSCRPGPILTALAPVRGHGTRIRKAGLPPAWGAKQCWGLTWAACSGPTSGVRGLLQAPVSSTAMIGALRTPQLKQVSCLAPLPPGAS